MAHKFERKFLLGGLNSDDEVRALPMGDYLDANNISNAVNDPNLGGTLTNVFGNVRVDTYICPYSAITNQLPAGINRTIGSEEDLIENTVVFFNYNSNGNHGIYRWYKDLVTTSAPYGEVQQIIEYDFGWQQDTRITAINLVYGSTGTLLYWADPTPHKINLTKGNICHKQKSWVSYMPLSYEGSALFFQVAVQTLLGGTITFINVTVAGGLTRDEMFTSIAAQINAGLSTYITAEACDCSMTITENQENTYLVVFSDGVLNQLLVPDNWYGFSLIDRFFDRCKWQPMNAPQAVYEQDTSFLPNYVQKKVFQFRLQYHYDDLEGSDLALGVWSQIPINNLGCDGNSNELLNYIDVDFNDDLLPLTTTLVLLREVSFIARELNTGADRSVIDLSPCDFIDYINGFFVCHFKFYNNIISSAIDPALAAKLFDNVPLEVNDEAYAKDRLVEGGILEGYNPLDCPIVDIKIQVGETPNQVLHKITGKIYIFNPRMDNNSIFPARGTQPNNLEARSTILYDTGVAEGTETVYPFFGGTYVGANVLQIESDAAYKFKRQILPEGGFTVYTAGQNYFNISRQINLPDLSQRADGSIDISTGFEENRLATFYGDLTNEAYSEFEILVPDGEYIIRLASHWCSFDDKLGKGYMYNLNNGIAYQQTSTFVWGVQNQFAGTPFEYNYELKVVVSGGDVYAGDFYISDTVIISPPFIPFVGVPFLMTSASGYLFDAEGAVDAASLARGVTVERALVRSTAWTLVIPQFTSYMQCITDHNGFWFIYPMSLADASQAGLYAFQLAGAVRTTTTIYFEASDAILSALYLLYNGTISTVVPPPLVGSGDPNYVEVIICTDTADARLKSSTFIQGNVVDSLGVLQPNIVVTFTHGRTVITNSDGGFNLLAWGDIQYSDLNQQFAPPFLINFVTVPKRVDYLVYQLSQICTPQYPNGQEFYCNIDPYGVNPNEYNPDFPFVVPDFTVDHTNEPDVKALKRGGNYIIGLRANDTAGRLSSVTGAGTLYIPFETEDLGNFPYVVDGSGNPFPTGTFKAGKPTITVTIGTSFFPPQYAANVQILRTKNLIADRFLQWAANSVQYISSLATDTQPEIATFYQNGNATSIKISLSNIVDYARQNVDSQVSYSFVEGDRLRLMYDSGLSLINGFYDLEVTSYDAVSQSVYVKSQDIPFEITAGFIFEIFNPKSVETEDEQIFYEVGEVIDCTAPNTPANDFATRVVTLANGDTYWRGRNIPVNDSVNRFAAVFPIIIEDASISDFYISLAQDIGRIGIIDANFRQLYNPTKMRASNMFLPSTSTNGLSSFEELNQIETDRNLGAIQRMFYINNTLINVNTNRELSSYIQVVTFQQATVSDGVLAVANQYFGTQYQHTKLLGTSHRASCFVNDGVVFGLQGKRGEVFRYQGDGEATISNVKMINYFNQLSADGVTDAVAIYDRYREQYILTVWRKYSAEVTVNNIIGTGNSYAITLRGAAGIPIPLANELGTVQLQTVSNGKWKSYTGLVTGVAQTGVTDIAMTVTTTDILNPNLLSADAVFIYSLPETIAWHNGDTTINKDRWVTKYSFTPECYAQTGSDIVSFKNGEIWWHNKNALRNNFYGVQYTSMVQPVFNTEPDIMKVWNACTLFQLQDDNGNDWAATSITNNNGQQSRLVKGSWVKKAENWYAAFKRDLNDTTKPLNQRITQGRNLRSSTLTCTLVNDYTGEVRLFEWQANWTVSQRSGK